jgi:hypothetical protein
MRRRALLLAPALIAAMVVGVAGSSASAATLFTSSAHTTRVTVGATAGLTTTAGYFLTYGTSTIYSCASATLNIAITQNSDAGVAATATGGTWSGCSLSVVRTFPWTLTVSGTGTVVATEQVWSTAAIDNYRSDFLGGFYQGTSVGPVQRLTTGISWQQPIGPTAPLCLVLNGAGTLIGPLINNGSFTGRYCFEGAASAWSMA